MAGDWIKVRCNLHTDPSVIRIAQLTALTEDAVVGKLVRIWSWMDQQTIDGRASGVTQDWLDKYVEHSGFAAAMSISGWLVLAESSICVPNWERHNGESAKKRALTSVRVHNYRTRAACNAVSVTDALPEKRREEINNRDVERVYAAYPKKVGKKRGLEAIREALKYVPVDELIAKVLRYADKVECARGTPNWRFVPHPAKWFGEARWTDDPNEPGPGRADRKVPPQPTLVPGAELENNSPRVLREVLEWQERYGSNESYKARLRAAIAQADAKQGKRPDRADSGQ